jgi:hypothetical protein
MVVSLIGGVPWENHQPAESHWQTLSHNVELTTLVVICTDCIDSCKSNYHAITVTTALGSRPRRDSNHCICRCRSILLYTIRFWYDRPLNIINSSNNNTKVSEIKVTHFPLYSWVVVDNRNKTNTEEYHHDQCTIKCYSISRKVRGEQKGCNNNDKL